MTTARWSLRDVVIVEGDRSASRGDAIAEEVPVALRYNGDPHLVMMATPDDLVTSRISRAASPSPRASWRPSQTSAACA